MIGVNAIAQDFKLELTCRIWLCAGATTESHFTFKMLIKLIFRLKPRFKN